MAEEHGATAKRGVTAWGRRFLSLLADPLRRNAVVLMANNGTGIVLGLAFWVISSRLYSTADVGMAAALVSASGVMSLLSLLGLDLGLIRFLPGSKDRRSVINYCLTVSTCVGLGASLVYIAGVSFWTPELTILRAMKPALLFIAATASGTLALLQGQVFIASRHPEYAWMQSLAGSVVRIPLALALTSYGLWGIWGAWTIASCVAAVAGNLILVRVEPGYRFFPSFRRKAMTGMGSFSAGAYVANLIGTAPVYVLPLVVLSVLGAEANAYYYLGYRVGAALYQLPWLVATSAFVEGSHSPSGVRELAARSVRFVLPMIGLALIVIFAFGRQILSVFGRDYSQSALWVFWSVSLTALPYAFNEFYLMVKRVQLEVAVTVYFSAFIGLAILGASYFLLLRIGLVGAGLGWLVGHLAGVAWVAVSLMRRKAQVNHA